MENNSKIFIVPIILLSAIILLLVGYIVYGKINTKNISLEENQEVVENSNQTQTEETIKTVEVEKIVEVEKAKLFNIDLNNVEKNAVITNCNECVYSMYSSEFTVYTDLSGNNPRATFFDSNSNSLIDIKVIGIDKKIIDVKMGPGYQGAEWYMYFLLEDGTVKVSKDVYTAKQSGILEMQKTIELEKRIVKLELLSPRIWLVGIDETGKTIKL